MEGSLMVHLCQAEELQHTSCARVLASIRCNRCFTQQAQNIAREDMLKAEQPAKHSPFGISNETWKSQSRWFYQSGGGGL
jgi:hypothetical protein